MIENKFEISLSTKALKLKFLKIDVVVERRIGRALRHEPKPDVLIVSRNMEKTAKTSPNSFLNCDFLV
jgi:hypothetical protein